MSREATGCGEAPDPNLSLAEVGSIRLRLLMSAELGQARVRLGRGGSAPSLAGDRQLSRAARDSLTLPGGRPSAAN